MSPPLINRAGFAAVGLVFILPDVQPASAAVTLVQRADYRQTSDSPWYPGIQNGSVYLENFLAGELGSRTFVTPYISAQAGRKGTESGYYSVDGDDGILDDFGRFGGSFIGEPVADPGNMTVSFRFDFAPIASGQLPRSVGLVVTHAGANSLECGFCNKTEVKAYDAFGQLIGGAAVTDLPESIITLSPSFRPYYTNGSRFIGLTSDIGILSFTISGVVAVDHVQYSFDRIPEPGSALLFAIASALTLKRRRGR